MMRPSRAVSCVISGARIASNETELSHRWRRRVWQTSTTVSLNQICSSQRPAVGSSDWLDAGSSWLNRCRVTHKHREQNTSEKHDDKQAENANPAPAPRLEKVDGRKNGPKKENEGIEIIWCAVTLVAYVGTDSQCDARRQEIGC